MTDDEDPWTYERLQPGMDFGVVRVPLDAARVKGWEAVYGPVSGTVAPDGLIVAGMMEAYIRAIQPRPDGNIHAAQRLAFTGAQAALGDEIAFMIGVAVKELRKGRRWVTFSARAAVEGRDLMRGDIVSIWAA